MCSTRSVMHFAMIGPYEKGLWPTLRVFGKAFASSLDDACVVNCDDEADFGSLWRNRGVVK
jgi:hypothetical protein